MKVIFLALLISSIALGDDLKDRFMKQTHFVSDQTFEQIYGLAKKYQGQDGKETQYTQDLRDAYCDGSTAKFIVTKTVNFKPEIDTGISLDGAQEQIFKQIEMAKFFFKQDFFYSSGWGSDVSKYLLHRSFLSDDGINGDHRISATDYRKFTHKNQQLALDMGFLVKHFTFKIPENQIAAMYGTPTDMFRMNKFGYQGGEFQASEAINYSMYIWRYVLIHDIQVKQAMKDGSIDFQMEWTPDFFCKYAIPLSSLKSM